jgi:hypothetical protein
MAAPAFAGYVDTPDCRRDLIAADRLVAEIQARGKHLKPQEIAGVCRVLRKKTYPT